MNSCFWLGSKGYRGCVYPFAQVGPVVFGSCFLLCVENAYLILSYRSGKGTPDPTTFC